MAISAMQATSSIISRYPYHVFLSFRGVDTRKNFTDHLYAALTQARIRTFRDEDEIERGENIWDEIHRAILHESKISLIVFSKNYALSTWCLDEIVKIMEHRKSSEHIAFPVFYDVDPSHVRNQRGSFAEAFAKHENSFKPNKEKVEQWREALREAADLGGMVLQDRHESQFIRDIVQHIQNKLHNTALHVPPYLVGIDFLVTCISWWLEDASNKVGIATICGIGGIGKTTIAKVAYNLNIQRFQGYSFLADVREASQQPNDLVRLQRQLVSDILQGKANKIHNVDDGIIKIKEAICRRRVLLVLDNVDHLDQITKLIGTQVPFHPGSKIFITTRHRHLVTEPFVNQMLDFETSSTYGDLCKVFEVKELSFNESFQLFNWYAFGQYPVLESYEKYASRAVEHCGGLPLALQVLGSSLSGKSIHVWKSALDKLEAIPHSKIQKILRISYDSLVDDHDKNLFLDIAYSFVGKDRDYATAVLDGCDFYTTIGIENLIDSSLLTINEKNRIMMHQMVRDMGMEIVHQESPNPGERSRLWHKEAFDVLREKSGIHTIRCLTVDLEGLSSEDAYLMSSEVDIETQTFTKMQKLKLLQMDYVKLKGDYKNFPKCLTWLRWRGCSLKSLPLDFETKKLVALDMRNGSLNHVWKNTKCLPNLKILNLNHSHELLRTPNFSGLLSLEKLMLKDCIKLIKVDQSISELKRLTFLNLKGCQSLRKLPRAIGSLESMEVLILSGCSTLYDLPKELQNMKSLRVLNLDETIIYESNSWLSWLPLLRRRKKLSFYWANLPCSLVKLSLESCGLFDEDIPNDLSCLPCLKCLNLSRNPIKSLPESIGSLTMLDELLLNGCTELQSLPKLPISSINGLDAKIVEAINRKSSLPRIMSFKKCVIFGCEKLKEIRGVFKLEPAENFEPEQIKSLFNMDSIGSGKVQIFNRLTATKIVTTTQVIHECGITSNFVPGVKVPTSFEHRFKGSKICFSLPPYPGEKIKWLNLCIMFSLANFNVLNFVPLIEITNETKRTSLSYFSCFFGAPATKAHGDTILWLLHWPVNHLQLEGGDTVNCLVVSYAAYSQLEIHEFGFSCGFGHYNDNLPYSLPGNGDYNITRNDELEVQAALLKLNLSDNVRVQIFNRLEDSDKVASPQVLYDCGILSSFDIGYIHGKTTPSKIYHALGPNNCFQIPQKPSQSKIKWLKSLIQLSANSHSKPSDFLFRVEIINETKHTKWTYSKSFVGILEAKGTMILSLNSWKFIGDEFESGDRISFRVLTDLCVSKCDIELIYDDFEENSLYNLGFLFVVYTVFLFGSQRHLYCRMNSLV